jgi:hypothetical protein
VKPYFDFLCLLFWLTYTYGGVGEPFAATWMKKQKPYFDFDLHQPGVTTELTAPCWSQRHHQRLSYAQLIATEAPP